MSDDIWHMCCDAQKRPLLLDKIRRGDGVDMTKSGGAYNMPLLYYAVEANDIQAAELMIKHGADAAYVSKSNCALYTEALKNDSREMFSLLVRNSCKLQQTLTDILAAAVFYRATCCVQYLLSKYVNVTDFALTTSMMQNDKKMFNILLRGLNVNAACIDLVKVLEYGNADITIWCEMVLTLLQQVPDKPNKNGTCAWHCVVASKQYSSNGVVAAMLAMSPQNTNVTYTNAKTGETALHCIMRGDGCVDTLRSVLEHVRATSAHNVKM